MEETSMQRRKTLVKTCSKVCVKDYVKTRLIKNSDGNIDNAVRKLYDSHGYLSQEDLLLAQEIRSEMRNKELSERSNNNV